MFVLFSVKNVMSGGKTLERAKNPRQPKEIFRELERKSIAKAADKISSDYA
jgi:hypothetical protein